jgi:tryptophan-rich sensory protein
VDLATLVKKLGWIDRVAGYVWVLLTLLMVLAIYALSQAEDGVWNRYSHHVIALIVVVWLYPLYTLGFRLVPGLIGNVAVGLLAIYVVWVVSSSSTTAAALIAPVVVWIAVATGYVVLQLLQAS